MPRIGAVLLVLLVGCGGRYGGPETKKPTPEGGGGIENAALPFQILDRAGHQVDEATYWARVVKARAVCIGEEHPNPHHHWVQLATVRELVKRLGKDTKLALGLEMIQRPFQGVVDDYAAKRIDAEALRSRAGWEERWNYDWGFYGPTIDAAVAGGAAILALNAPKELTKKVVRHGLESLTPDEKAQVPELKLDDAAHRAWFDALMEGMGGSAVHSQKQPESEKEESPKEMPKDAVHGGGSIEMPSADRVYTVQVIWDETMADGAAKWLASNPGGHVVILAGNGHCHDSAIVGRMKRRGVTDAISLHPVIDDGEGAVAELLAKPMNDFVIVLQMPKETKDVKTAAVSR